MLEPLELDEPPDELLEVLEPDELAAGVVLVTPLELDELLAASIVGAAGVVGTTGVVGTAGVVATTGVVGVVTTVAEPPEELLELDALLVTV